MLKNVDLISCRFGRQGAVWCCCVYLCLVSPLFAQEWNDTWATIKNRRWLGPACWAQPLQSWRIVDGKAICEGRESEAQVHLLRYQCDLTSEFTMRVTIHKDELQAEGIVGLRIGRRGKNLNEYRHNCIHGKEGLRAAVTSRGELILGRLRSQISWGKSVTLVLRISNSSSGRVASLSALNEESEVLGSLSLDPIPMKLAGNLLLFCQAFPVSKLQSSDHRGRFSFSDWKLSGTNLKGSRKQDWGPILWTQHTVNRGIMKMTAQFPPLGEKDDSQTELEVTKGGKWVKAATASINPYGWTAPFRVTGWDQSNPTNYRVVYKFDGQRYEYSGVVRKDPIYKNEIAVAAFTGNKDYGFPNTHIVENVSQLDPDLLFFSGDQLYEDVGGYGYVRGPKSLAHLDYLRKWYLFGWSFGELMRSRPTVILPDDHDVFQGNVWGAGGKSNPTEMFNRGGYTMPAEWINMVQRTQVSHLPDCPDPKPIDQGITVCFTDLVIGGVSFAIIEDRKFKSGPRELGLTKESAKQLGPRQLKFLESWAADWSGAEMKVLLSQTVFAQCHTYGGKKLRKISRDRDSNGWPPHARDRSVSTIRKCFPLMIGGDNHLPTIAHHGIDDWEDAGVSFTVPSIAAGFPREWRPMRVGLKRANDQLPGYASGHWPKKIPGYVGRYISSWGHHLTMLACANPKAWTNKGAGDFALLDRKASGFGLVRIKKAERTFLIECFRLLANLKEPQSSQFKGWPIELPQRAMYGRAAAAFLPKIVVQGAQDPVVMVKTKQGELIYSLRIKGSTFRPWVFDSAQPHRVDIVRQDGKERTLILSPVDKDSAAARLVKFD